MKRPRHQVDLSSLQASCEANYWRLLRLLPAAPGVSRVVDAEQSGQRSRLVLEVLERCPYTTRVRLQSEQSHWFCTLPMEVCLYHDAGMAEVVPAAGRRQYEGRYAYPNRQMLQPDEKLQQNRFLGEWLGFYLSHGLAAESIW